MKPAHRKPGKKNTKELIYAAAVEVIANLGFYSATTDVIAEKAGVSVGTIYNYFRSKEEILSAIFERELSKRLMWLRKLQEEPAGAKEVLERFFHLHCTDFQDSLQVARILLRERSFARNHDPQALTSYMEQVPKEIMKILKAGQRSGELRDDLDVRLAAAIVFSAMEGIVTAAVEGGDDSLLAQGHASLTKILWGGLGKT